MADGFNNRPNFGSNLLDNLGSNFAGILSTRPTATYMSGARCVLKMNDKICGFAFGITWKISTNYTEINTIDDYLPYELAPQRVQVEGTLSALHIPGQNSTTQLWQPDVLSFLFHKYVSIEVRDVQTDQLLFATRKAMITSKTEDIKVDALSNVTLTWRAIGWIDERTPELPDGATQPSTAGSNNGSRQTGVAGVLGNIGKTLRGFNV